MTSDSITLTILLLNNPAPLSFSRCVSLHYSKEQYIPYSSLNASFILDDDVSSPLDDIIDVELVINNTKIHKGIIDTYSVKVTPKLKILTIASRSHTSMLAQNEIFQGMRVNPSLNSLMAGMGTVDYQPAKVDFFTIPFVAHEDNSTTVNNVYVKPKSSLWDAVVALCIKQSSTFPYIAHTNTIRYTHHPNPKSITLNDSNENVISCSYHYDYSKMISDIYMANIIEDQPDHYINKPEVISREIVRNKYIPLDMQWLSPPSMGLVYKTNLGMRGYKTKSVAYRGYFGEDLCDFLSYGNMQNVKISKISIVGGTTGIVTTLTAYFDKYCNV